MNDPTVVLTVPSTPRHLSLLRAMVGYYAGRERFTIDQIDDLRMAVEECGIQLLRRNAGDTVSLEIARIEGGILVRVSATVAESLPVIDQSSFSWTILQSLADELTVDTRGTAATVVLAKHHLPEMNTAPGGGG